MMRKTKILAVFFGVLALWAGNLRAGIITINLTAEVTRIDDRSNLLKGQLHIGDIITGSYTYNSTTPDSNPAIEVGMYRHYSSPYGIYLSGGGFVFQTDPANVDFVVEVCNGNTLWYDSYLVGSSDNLPLYEGVTVETIHWQLDDHSGTALSGDALPTTAPVLEDWPDTWSGLTMEGQLGADNGQYYFIRSTVTSAELVPEPATLLLLGFGSLALLTSRKR